MTVTTPAPAPQAPPERPSMKWLSLVAVGLLVAVCIAAFAVSKIAAQPSLEDARAEAVTAATIAVTEIFTGPTNPRARVERAGDLMTERFRAAMLTPASGRGGSTGVVSSRTTVREASAADCGDDCTIEAIDVLVFADETLVHGTSAGAGERLSGVRVLVRMVEQDGRWLVDGVQNL